MTQLSLVEHALCPLNTDVSLRPNMIHSAAYFFTDKQGARRKASARVVCPDGLSAFDELYLWGLLALTFSQPEPAIEFTATPHYCLRQLGLIDHTLHRGGKTYKLFRGGIERLSAVTYQNDNFYDPLRGEHCQVSFGFFSYRLPLSKDSSRAWRFYWDPLFFEICQATRSALAFDLGVYRQLDNASRRLYLLLKKMFWRRTNSLRFDVRHLAVNVLGFAANQEAWRLKAKLMACIGALVDHGILAVPEGRTVKDLFQKQRAGQYGVFLHRGPQFDRTTPASRDVIDSPHYELLQTIGFDVLSVARILRTYPSKLVAEWIDITLAAWEHRGLGFFSNSPQAFFLDNLREAAAGKRTPPDWWRKLRKEEERQRRRDTSENSDAALEHYLETEAREAYEKVTQRIFADLVGAGRDETDARERAAHIARNNLRTHFYREHPEYRPVEPSPFATAEESEDRG